uniref:Myosin motor domain-containing protein n=1 Tax=Hucho hucho TaxID=62062 RepID=A0A4W5L5V4_9TELE
RIFSVLSAILYLGNVTYSQSEDGQGLEAGPPDILSTLCDLLKVKQELLVEALTKRKQMTANNTVVLHYTLKEVGALTSHHMTGETPICCYSYHLKIFDMPFSRQFFK